MEKGEAVWLSEERGRLSVARLGERGFPRWESRRVDLVVRWRRRKRRFEVVLNETT